MKKNMKIPNNFAIFILSNGRPDNIKTLTTLKLAGYTGKWYIICDNEDARLNEYVERYRDKVIVFDKQKEFERADNADLTADKRVILYARNASFEIAKKLGLKYFMELDDDYTSFHFRYNSAMEFITRQVLVRNIDRVITLMLDFYESVPNLLTLAMMQGGDFVGGYQNDISRRRFMKRKAMNSFICSPDRYFQFVGRVNEDVNTYCVLGMRGKLLMSVPQVYLNQAQTQFQKGGMSEMYKDYGTYMKSFYTVMYCPAFVKLNMFGMEHTRNPKRIHHNITWKNAVPKILSEKYRKI